ncbi:hypothetical protein IH779_03380 [Patescibacteria group bacterium]|nr:hypothetical protein [Patescibacteria group bacterium]
MKKILLPIFIISVLFIFLFLGMNYTGKNLASISGLITTFVTINPLEVNVSAPAEVEVNKAFQVKVEIINKGEEGIENGTGEIFLPPELVLVKKDPVQRIGVIRGKKEKKISWAVKGIETGNHIIIVSVSGELKGDLISAEGSRMVEVIEFFPRGKARGWLQNLFGFFQEWFKF